MSILNFDLTLVPEHRRKRALKLVDEAISRFPMAEDPLRVATDSIPRDHDFSCDGVAHGTVGGEMVKDNG